MSYMPERDFLELVATETGLEVHPEDGGVSFDDVPGWSSIYMLMIASGYARESGVRLKIADMFESKSLHELWEKCVSGV